MKKITQAKNIYFIGIKGVGMTALAQILKRQGYLVTGSDTAEVFFTDKVLRDEKISFFNGFSADNLESNIDLIIYSTAYNLKNNVEMKAANSRNIPMMDLAHAISELFNSHKKGIAVCGTHGKSTTSALLSFVLWDQKKHPTALIGSAVPQFKGNALAGTNDLMVIEADEYNNKLQYYKPYGVVLNNIEYDHPDFFPTFSQYKKAFKNFVTKVPDNGFVVANFDDPNVKKICSSLKTKILSYSTNAYGDTNKEAMFTGTVKGVQKNSQYFTVYKKNKKIGDFQMKLIGNHHVHNAMAVIITCLELKLPVSTIQASLSKFNGLARRMEILGKYKGSLIFDDYAHHPSEVQATLQATRLRYPDRKIICAFMSHTYTRTQALLNDFVKSFSAADEVIILPIYASAREKKGLITGKILTKHIAEYEYIKQPGMKIHYISSLKHCADYLKKNLNRQDIVILMGAGDAFRVWHYMK